MREVMPMTFAEYKKSLSELGHGKRLPGAIYVHTECMPLLPDALRAVVLKIADTLSLAIEAGAASVDSHTFNLLKFHLASFKLSFLRYPDFWNDPHPALAEAVTVDLASGSARRQNFAPRANPPILHRKEAFLPPDHPQVPTFATLTRAEESFGLFAETHTIGFRDNWNRLVASKGLAYEDHELCPLTSPVPETARRPAIDRHLTALVRQEFSKPVKVMLETALLAPGKDFFDYGCGYGSDARGLSAMGYQAAGWDPAHAPDHPVFPADVVNLGFVLNVIEDPAERVDTLVKAWNVSRRVLVVTTLVAGCESSTAHTGYGDGVRTSRNTFQKYFEQTELLSLLEQALHVEPIPLGLGMFAVFRDDSAREDFLSRRSRRHFDWHQISRRLGFAPPPRQRRDVYAEHGPLLDDFWATMLELGRLPAPDEYSRIDEVRKGESATGVRVPSRGPSRSNANRPANLIGTRWAALGRQKTCGSLWLRKKAGIYAWAIHALTYRRFFMRQNVQRGVATGQCGQRKSPGTHHQVPLSFRNHSPLTPPRSFLHLSQPCRPMLRGSLSPSMSPLGRRWPSAPGHRSPVSCAKPRHPNSGGKTTATEPTRSWQSQVHPRRKSRLIHNRLLISSEHRASHRASRRAGNG